MTTSLPHTHVRQRDLTDLVAGLPSVFGFPPTDSLVLFTFRRYPEVGVATTIRVDLPKPEHVPQVAAELSDAVAMNEAVAVIAVVVTDTGAEHRLLIDLFRKALDDKNILLSHASWVPKAAHGEQWQCYDDPLCTGVVPDPQTSTFAAARAVAGDLIYPDREAMAAQLAPDPKEVLVHRKKLLKAHGPHTEADLWADLELLGHALDIAGSSYDLPQLTDHQMVRLARALSLTPVKDECLGMALSDEPEPAERLWTVLVRGLPASARAEPAFLLAMSAYLRGAGVLAGMALKIALKANPEHGMAGLLDRALQMGFPPERLRSALIASIIKNNEKPVDDDPPWDTTEEQDPPVPPSAEEVAACSTPSSAAAENTPDPGQVPASEPPRVAPGPLGQRTAVALGIPVDGPVQQAVTMNALTAFLPPPTERSGPG